MDTNAGTFEIGQADTLVDARAFWSSSESERERSSLITVKKKSDAHVWPHIVL
jgi:hypothetical protein